MKRRTFIQTSAAGTLILVAPMTLVRTCRRVVVTPLEEGFRHPPTTTGVRTWWHWMNGNITADGITRDLEAMQRVGAGGFQIFQVGSGIVKGPVDYASPEHIQLLEHAAKEAERLGLEFDMHNCPGWSSSGGPWITPELSMQQMVWSETLVTGGKEVNIALPQPPANLGYYRDAFVLAFPALPGENRPLRDLLSRVTSSSGPVDAGLFTDGDSTTGVEVRSADPDSSPYLQLEFTEPFEARSIFVTSSSLVEVVQMEGFGRGGATLTLEASDDGVQFRRVSEIAATGGRGTLDPPATATFPAVRARYFRLVLPDARLVTRVQLSGAARIDDWLSKANFTSRRGGMMMFGEIAEPPSEVVEVPSEHIIDPESVVDITRYIDEQGQLNWEAPAGDWTILRLGHTTLGIENHPAPDGGGGLECDKFSGAAYEYHFNNFFGELLPVLESLGAKGLSGSIIDSYETGFQNWTPEFPQEFQQSCGYDLWNYLPAMTGRVVGSVDISDRFLWDVRRTQADMMADNYYGRFAEMCRRHGMKSYAEPYSGGPFDELQIASRVDVPMGEFPMAGGGNFDRTVKLAASAAHLYGKPVVGAEGFTGVPSVSSWQEHPYLMKAQGDWMFTRGLNQFIFHRYAHQPHPSAVPGMTMGQWGWQFERTNTWWNQGKGWLDYLARCHYMLQQGLFVADLLYFAGEDAPVSAPSPNQLDPAPPVGYDYDAVNAETILTQLKVENGRIVLPSGMSYRALVLPDETEMTLELLRKIRDLVEQGMCLVGPKPEHAPNLVGYPENEAEVRRIASELWGDLNGMTITERSFGKGRVFWGQSLQAVLDELGVKPDFEFTGRSADAPITCIHRRVGDAEVYFVANRRRRSEEVVCTFRVDGKLPEFWNAETGEITPAGIYELVDGRTRLPIRFDPAGSIFVVFRSPAPGRSLQAVSKDGVTVVGTEPFPVPAPGFYRGVTNNFTISVWVKPEVNVTLPGTAGRGFLGAGGPGSGTGYVFYPPAGEVVYGQGHAACGLVAGRNGIALYERASGSPTNVLVVEMPLAGWTHLTVVYRDGVPSLYVDGKLNRRGEKSGQVVHPGIGEAYINDGGGDIYYIGHMSEPELFTEALGEDRIRTLAGVGIPKPEEPPTLELAGDEDAGLLIWQNGGYTLRDNEGRSSTVQISEIGQPVEIAGPWRVSFPPNRGAPAEITLPELMSLRMHSEPGVKYFSGTATYSKRFNVGANAIADNKRLYVDLGWVETIAEVLLNGQNLGIVWKPPYRVDITDAVRSNDNDLEVRVTNLWLNRLIGDEHLPPENEYGEDGAIIELPDWYLQGKPKPPGGRVTFTTWKHYTKDDPLLESGLIGPVLLRPAVRHAL